MKVDLAIVGAGPAGMAAATLAAELGLATILLDEQRAPGGQIYRGIEQVRDAAIFGTDYAAGRPLVEAFRACAAQYWPASTVWHIDPEGTLSIVRDGQSDTIEARRILIAAGAIERPVPIPGWTLPGVMTAGAAQILLKTGGLIPDGRTVLAGQGPLLYLIGWQLARAGAPPVALLDTTTPANYRAAMVHFGDWWLGRRDLAKGFSLIARLRRAGVTVRRRVRRLRAIGRNHVEAVAWEGGEMAADLLLLHEGVIPNTQISLGLQLEHRWDEAQMCWHPILDEWGRSSLVNLSIAGDGGGIAGANAAASSGRLAALDAASALGMIDAAERDRRARRVRAALNRDRGLRPFLDALYRPATPLLNPPDDVVVCRCEEVSAGQIRRAVRLGATGPNQAKAFLRCGMGPCQGRLCGPVIGPIIAAARSVRVGEVGTYRPRAPYKPISLGTLANFGADSDGEDEGVAAAQTPGVSG